MKWIVSTSIRITIGVLVGQANRMEAQNQDSTQEKRLDEIIIKASRTATVSQLPQTVGTALNGSVGKVRAYGLFDINLSYKISNQVNVRINLNNVMNQQYFTKRPQFYPGPGIWSSDDRSQSVSIGIKIC